MQNDNVRWAWQFIFGVLVLGFLFTMALILNGIDSKLSDIRTITSEARDALWCIQSPSTNDCQP